MLPRVVSTVLLLVLVMGLLAQETPPEGPAVKPLPPRPLPSEPLLPDALTLREETLPKSAETLPAGATHRFGTVAWRLPQSSEATLLPNGKEILVTRSRGGVAPPEILDATTGKLLRPGADGLRPGHLSADGKYLLWSDPDGKGWNQSDAATGKLVRPLEVRPSLLGGPVFSRDGKQVAIPTGEMDQTAVEVLDLETGQKRATVHPASPFLSLAFSPDGKTLASLTLEGVGAFWDLGTGKKQAGFTSLAGAAAFPLAYTPDGKYLLFPQVRSVVVWDAVANRQHHIYPLEGWLVGFSPDGTHLVHADWVDCERRLHLVKALTGERVLTFTGAVGNVTRVQFSADGQRMMTQVQVGLLEPVHGNHLRVWDVATGREYSSVLGHSGPVRALQFLPDGKTLVSASDGDPTRFWDLTNRGRCRVLVRQGIPREARAVSPDGQAVITFGAGGTTLRRIDGPAVPGALDLLCRGACFSPDGKQVASSANSVQGDICKSFPADDFRKPLWTVQPANEAIDLRFSPGGRWLAVGVAPSRERQSPTAQFIEATMGNLGKVVPGALLGFEPGTGHLMTRPEPSQVGFWNPADGTRVRTVSLFRGVKEKVIYSAAIPADGRLLAVAAETELLLLDRTGTKTLARLTGHTGPVLSLAFSPDGQTLASGGQDGTILLWDVAGLGR